MTEYDPCNPATWPAEAKAKIAAIEAKERSVAEELRRKRKAYLESLGRVSLADAIEMARAAGKPEPWPWVRAQIQGRKLPAWGTHWPPHRPPVRSGLVRPRMPVWRSAARSALALV